MTASAPGGGGHDDEDLWGADDPWDGPWTDAGAAGGAGGAGGIGGLEDDPRIQAGLEHLQRAAREMIAASRTLLDAAEDLVEDPRAAAGILDLLGSLAARRPDRRSGGSGGSSGPDDDGPPVQRIPVS